MKKNLYYAAIYKRQNWIKLIILSAFYLISSYPRLLLEVFLRRNMGERYFTLASALTILFILGGFPKYALPMYAMVTLINNNKLYYAFLAVFLVFSLLRYLEVKRLPSVFDFARFSQSGGNIYPIFYKLKLFGEEPSIRTIEIFYEPLPFFIFGALLTWAEIGTFLGPVLTFSSLLYCLSHAGGYMIGDYFIMDRIDEIICNEDLTDAFVKDKPSPRGFVWYGKKPTTEDLREEYVEDIAFEEVDDETEAR